MKNLYKPENEAEAIALKKVLEDHNIIAVIQSFHDTAYNGIFQNQYGWGVIRVEDSDFEKAEEIITEWKNATPEDLEWDQV